MIIGADLSGRTHMVGAGLSPGVTMAELNIPGTIVLLLAGIIIVLNFLIVRAIWRAVNKSPASAGPTGPSTTGVPPVSSSRLSRTAVWGGIWMVALPTGLVMNALAILYTPRFPAHDPMRLLIGLPGMVLIVLGVIGFFGTTTLGWMAVGQIRRSAGKLHGLGLAVFEGLVFPLLALDAVIGRAWVWIIGRIVASYTGIPELRYESTLNPQVTNALVNQLQHTSVSIALLATAITAVVVDYLIIRRVWRAVNRSAGSAVSPPAADSPLPWRQFAFGPVILVVAGFLGLLMMGSWATFEAIGRPAAIRDAALQRGFDAVVERELTANSTLSNAFLDLDTGKVLSAPKELLVSLREKGVLNNGAPPAAAIRDWMRTSGADLIVKVGFGAPDAATDLVQIDGVSGILNENSSQHGGFTFETITSELLLRWVAPATKALPSVQDAEKQWGYAPHGLYYFKTREGHVGVLEFLEAKPDKVKLRSKLVSLDGAATAGARSRVPKSAHIVRNAGSVFLHHDDVDLHYALFATKAVGSSVSDQYDNNSPAWRDHGSFKVTEQQTFAYDRESTDPFHLRLNGQEYDLRRGRVLVVHDDGTVEQLQLFPPLATASNPDELAKLIASARTMHEEPLTVEKLRQQLDATEAQLHDVLKTCAPTNPFVVDLRRSVDVLKQKIGNETARSGGGFAFTAFGPVMERAVTDFLDLDSGKLLQPPNPLAGKPMGWLERGATPEWMAQQGIDATWASDGLIGVDLTVLPLDNQQWDASAADWLLNRLKHAHPTEPMVKIVRPDNLPATWGFKTREGGVGILQIVGTVVGANGDGGLIIPKLRFKLVQGPSEPAALKSTADSTAPAAATAPAPPAGWRERFENTYRMNDGELVKHIQPPFIPERADFYRTDESLNSQAKTIPEAPNYLTFHQAGRELHLWGYGFNGSDKHTLNEVLRDVGELKRYEIEGSAVLLKLSLEGDWIIREVMEKKALMEALAVILCAETKRNIRIEKRAVEREAIIARGQAKGGGSILIYAENPGGGGRGGGNGDLSKFFAHLGSELGIPIVNEVTGGEQTTFSWEGYRDANYASMDARLDELTAKVLKNITAQTGFSFTREKRSIETWFVTEQ